MQKEHFILGTLATLMAVFSSTAAMGQSESASDFDWLKDVTERIQLHGYAQGGFDYTHQGGEDKANFNLKRVLFWTNAQITDRWSFLFMHDFSSVVQEYYTDFRITNNKALTVRLGQFKNGVSLENPLSPTSMEALFGETNNGKLRYEAQVMNGQGINKKDGNKEKDFIARLEYRPVKSLNLIATGQIGRGHAIKESLYNPDIKEGDNYKRNRWTGEYLEGKDGCATSRGAYVTGNIPVAKGLDIIGSYDFFNFNTSLGMDQHKAIAGFQYWFYKKCRFQVQYVYKSAYTQGGQFIHGANHAILAQVQVRLDYVGKKSKQ